MGEAAKATGLPEAHLDFRGKRYPVAPWTPEMTGLFEAWLEQRAWDVLERMRPNVTPDVFRERSQMLLDHIASGGLGFGSEAAAKAGRSLEGMKYSLFLQLKAGSPEDETVTQALVEDLFAGELQKAIEVIGRANAPDPTTPPATSGATT